MCTSVSDEVTSDYSFLLWKKTFDVCDNTTKGNIKDENIRRNKKNTSVSDKIISSKSQVFRILIGKRIRSHRSGFRIVVSAASDGCVRGWERESERDSVYESVTGKRGSERECVWEGEEEGGGVCVCVCVREKERMRVSAWAGEGVRERGRVWVRERHMKKEKSKSKQSIKPFIQMATNI